jgi:hypothetical protein
MVRSVNGPAVALLVGLGVAGGSCVSACETPQLFRRAPVDLLFAEWNRSDSPGCAVGVGRNGATLYERGRLNDTDKKRTIAKTSTLAFPRSSCQIDDFPQRFGGGRGIRAKSRRATCREARDALESLALRRASKAKRGGGRGIRTPGTLPGTVVFKTTAIDHSAIPPR